jgi:hypothetical protein
VAAIWRHGAAEEANNSAQMKSSAIAKAQTHRGEKVSQAGKKEAF